MNTKLDSMVNKIKGLFSSELHSRLAILETKIDKIYEHLKIEEKVCPICGHQAKAFLPSGYTSRPNALCPNCRSLERHRMIWLFLKERTKFLIDKIHMLHIAPEEAFYNKFSRQKNIEYLSSDLDLKRRGVHVKMDIQQIQYPDNSFDAIICCHVLEHVADDSKAMRELCRVLKPGGWALLQVPIRYNLATTLEKPEYNTPELRMKHYGQDDHLRAYGLDYADRLRASGFKVDVIDYVSALSRSEAEKYALPERDDIFFCTK